jgi:hypothetical protein
MASVIGARGAQKAVPRCEADCATRLAAVFRILDVVIQRSTALGAVGRAAVVEHQAQVAIGQRHELHRGIVVGQVQRLRRAPADAILGTAAVDVVGPAAAIQRQEAAFLERLDIHVHAPHAARHLVRAPVLAAIGGTHHHADVVVARPALTLGHAAHEDRTQPGAVGSHHDGLAHEGAGGVEQGLDRPPAAAQVTRDAATHDGRVLVARQLRGIDQPQLAVRRFEEHRILLGAAGVFGQAFRLAPGIAAGGQAREVDRDIGNAFLGAAEPGAQQVAIGQGDQVGGVVLHGHGRQVGLAAGGVAGGLADLADGAGGGLAHLVILYRCCSMLLVITVPAVLLAGSLAQFGRGMFLLGGRGGGEDQALDHHHQGRCATRAIYMLSMPKGLSSRYQTLVAMVASTSAAMAPRATVEER